jgi:hypothetical protein
MPRHHIIISGTGRAGTTFLVRLLTELGLDTGFPKDQKIDPNSRAGMELDIRDGHAPYIIKSPWLCDYLDDVLEGGEIIVDGAIIPMRDLYSAAESRRYVAGTANPNPGDVPGGLWHTTDPEDQERILTGQLYKLIYALAKHDVPVNLLLFPKLVYDPEYLYKKIKFLLGDLEYDAFQKIFQMISRPKLVHDFASSDNDSDYSENPLK